MIKNGQKGVVRFPFRPPVADAGVEVVDWDELQRRAGAQLRRPHRTDFHQLLLVDAGRVHCRVDFARVEVRRRGVLWVRPGQVQQLPRDRRPKARMLLFEAHFPAPAAALRPLLDGPLPPATWRLRKSDYNVIGAAVEGVREHALTGGDPLRVQLAQHLLTALLLRLAGIDPAQPPRPVTPYAEVYARLHAELERSFTTTRRADQYAQRLGYSVKTLTRACHAMTGMSVKQAIDARVVLEAQRRLAHTEEPIEALAAQLGFSEATNFAKFFQRHAGQTPGRFRAAVSRRI
jgi:AraC-like DNA-binding protein